MSEDIPDPERTVTVDEAHLLRAQIGHSEEQAAEDDEIDEQYHNKRIGFTEKYIEEIESEGISEPEIEDNIDRLNKTIGETKPNTDERIAAEAELDTVRQINHRYFDGGRNVVEVEAVRFSAYESGAIEFQDSSGKAIVSFPGEGEARAAADAILDCNGIEEEAASVGMR